MCRALESQEVACCRAPSGYTRSVELVNESVALVKSGGSGAHPVSEDDGVVERPQHHVDVADAETPQVDEPTEDPEVSESFNLLKTAANQRP